MFFQQRNIIHFHEYKGVDRMGGMVVLVGWWEYGRFRRLDDIRKLVMEDTVSNNHLGIIFVL